MEKKTIIVTGADGALGSAVVKRLSAADYQVVAVVRPGKNVPQQANIHLYETDLSDDAAAAWLAQQVFDRYKSLHAFIMIAGGFSAGGFLETGKKELEKMISLNFETAYFLTRHTLPKALEQPFGCRYVFVGSKTALEPDSAKDAVAYALSKSLLFRLSEIVNAKGKFKNIVSSVIAPSIIDTPQNRRAMPQANHVDWISPDAIAQMIETLCSDSASTIRDTVIRMYGNV